MAAALAALSMCCGLLVAGAGTASASASVTTAVLRSVNGARVSIGLQPYTLRADLSAVALAWSSRMARSSVLRHNPALRHQVRNFRWAGENVGYGPSWRPIFEALMASPRHRANILDDDFTEIGVGIVRSGGRIWVTQVFRDPKPMRRSSDAARVGAAKAQVSVPATESPAGAVRSSAQRPPVTSPSERAGQRPTRAAAADWAVFIDRVRNALRSPPAATLDDPVGAALAYAATMRALTH